MKATFWLKLLIVIYSLLFLVPLFFILWLSNDWFFIILKVLLGLWMVFTFFQASQRHPNITLGPFICFLGLFFMLWWFFQPYPISYLFSLLFVMWFFGKFWQVNKIVNEAEKSLTKDK